jgi:hypothetical protein
MGYVLEDRQPQPETQPSGEQQLERQN